MDTKDVNRPADSAAAAGSPLVEVPSDRVFKAKSPCPYCGGEIRCSANGWEQEEDGTWTASDLDIECSNEPPIDSKRWRDWDAEHGRHSDYGDAWYRLHEALVRGLKRRFRFKMENADSSDRAQ